LESSSSVVSHAAAVAELGAAAREATKASVRNAIEIKVQQWCTQEGSAEVIQTVRQAVLEDVEARVSEKADELWRRGQTAIVKMEEKHREKARVISDEVTRMTERQRHLEAENESLKQMISALAGRFATLGAVFGGGVGVPSPVSGKDSVDGSTPFGPMTPLLIPVEGDAKSLPEVPAFPMQTVAGLSETAATAAAPLSLADALGGQTAARTPLSLASSLAPTPAGATPAPIPEAPGLSTPRQAGRTFTFTIRKADTADLGLNVSHVESDRVLQVEGVRAEGAVEAWNRQCANGAMKDKAVQKGDRIIQVNDVSYDPVKMLEECRDRQLLRLTIVRGEASPATVPNSSPVRGSPSVLRADASVFVPMSAVVPEKIPELAKDTPEAQSNSPKDAESNSPGQAQDTDGSSADSAEKA
jgi:hypothetical protein